MIFIAFTKLVQFSKFFLKIPWWTWYKVSGHFASSSSAERQESWQPCWYLPQALHVPSWYVQPQQLDRAPENSINSQSAGGVGQTLTTNTMKMWMAVRSSTNIACHLSSLHISYKQAKTKSMHPAHNTSWRKIQQYQSLAIHYLFHLELNGSLYFFCFVLHFLIMTEDSGKFTSFVQPWSQHSGNGLDDSVRSQESIVGFGWNTCIWDVNKQRGWSKVKIEWIATSDLQGGFIDYLSLPTVCHHTTASCFQIKLGIIAQFLT